MLSQERQQYITVARTSYHTDVKIRDSRKSRQKNGENTAGFCKNRKNHGKITAVYIAANLLKLVVSNSQNN